MPFRSVRDSSYFPLNFDYAGRYLRAILRLGLHMDASSYELRVSFMHHFIHCPLVSAWSCLGFVWIL